MLLRAALLACLGLMACRREPPPDEALPDPPGHMDDSPLRTRAAAVTIRFSAGGLEPGSTRLGADRLQVSAVFADIDRRDLPVLADLVGQPTVPQVPSLDSCVRQAEAWQRPGARPVAEPQAWVQLLDVGNVSLHAASAQLGLRVQMVPSLLHAIRGVRYDGDQDMGRAWLASGVLRLVATGGDGVAAFDAKIAPPRPVRLTWLGSQSVRTGRVQGPDNHQDFVIRWGSVDGGADLEVQLGAEDPGGLGWVRCRLRDDGEFTIPAALIHLLPPRTPERPWLLVLVRSRLAAVPGFDGTPLRLELTDSAYVQ